MTQIAPADKVSLIINCTARERQRILFSAVPVAGDLVMSYNGNAFTALAYGSISAANLQTKLRTITGLSAVTVAQNAAYDYEVDFVGVLNNPLMLVDESTDLKSAVDTAATAVLNITNDITLTKAAIGTVNNGRTFTLQVLAAAANPTDTVLAAFTGTAAAITLTITPNDGTNNAATPVDLTTAEVRELITTGAVAGKTVTLTDASSLRALQTATGGDATNVADGGEGDGAVATFAGGANDILVTLAITQEVKGRS